MALSRSIKSSNVLKSCSSYCTRSKYFTFCKHIRKYSCGNEGGSKKDFKVCCIGAAGGIGQPLSLLLKLNPLISELRLHDLHDVPGVAADLSHVETKAKVTCGTGDDASESMKDADVIVVPAGRPRKPGMARADLFNSNAQIAFNVAKQMAKAAPNAIVIFITNPLNSVVPIAAEVLKKEGKFNPRHVMGCTTLDSVRSATFLAEFAKVDPQTVSIPCVGGHSGATIVPLVSRATVSPKPDGEILHTMTKRIQEAGTEVVKAKAGKGSATLSMAYSASRLLNSLLRAMSGDKNICECVYVKNDNFSKVSYVATPWLLGKNGLEKDFGLGKLSDYEKELFCKMLEGLAKDIKAGEEWVKKQLEEIKC